MNDTAWTSKIKVRVQGHIGDVKYHQHWCYLIYIWPDGCKSHCEEVSNCYFQLINFGGCCAKKLCLSLLKLSMDSNNISPYLNIKIPTIWNRHELTGTYELPIMIKILKNTFELGVHDSA